MKYIENYENFNIDYSNLNVNEELNIKKWLMILALSTGVLKPREVEGIPLDNINKDKIETVIDAAEKVKSNVDDSEIDNWLESPNKGKITYLSLYLLTGVIDMSPGFYGKIYKSDLEMAQDLIIMKSYMVTDDEIKEYLGEKYEKSLFIVNHVLYISTNLVEKGSVGNISLNKEEIQKFIKIGYDLSDDIESRIFD
jgi:hypothetical protein